MSDDEGSLSPVLERLYQRWHRPQFIVPDPLQLVRTYRKQADREVAAFICASLALGRVESILKASRRVLEAVGPPSELVTMSESSIRRRLRGFVFRFFDTGELTAFLFSLGHVLRNWGSLESAFAADLRPATVFSRWPAQRGLISLVAAMRTSERVPRSIILADPEKQSASKRMHLFLRWMVRRDAIDPGGWEIIRPADLLVPVDVHMHRIAAHFGLTARAGADFRTSTEITAGLRRVDQSDPVRFDFSLTRVGIHPEGTLQPLSLPASDARAKAERVPKNERQFSQKVIG